MKDELYTDEMISGFLLKQLPEADSEAIEAKFFSDIEYFERICAVENLLIDGYVGGRLSRQEGELFERNYLTTTARRQKVAFAKSLARATSQVQTAEPNTQKVAGERTVPWWQAMLASLRDFSLMPQLAMAMALLLLAGGIFALVKITSLNRDLIAANQQRLDLEARQQELNRQLQELERKVAEGNSESDELAKEIERLRNQQKELEKQQLQRQDNEPLAPSIASFLLVPGSVRGTPQGAKTLAIAPATTLVQLRIKFDSNDYATYQVQVRTVEGAQVWTQRGLKGRAVKDGATVFVNLPAKKLSRNDYLLILSGSLPSGELEEVEKYFFRVENR